MPKPSIRTVAVVGAGVIGRSWIHVFARAGCTVRVYDAKPGQAESAIAWLERDLESARRRGDLTAREARARRVRVTAAATLPDAVRGVGWVQESGPEDLDLKRAMYGDLDAVTPARAIIGSSTSALDMSAITAGLAGAGRCVVAHPVNPPHVIPVVEVLGGAATDAAVVRRTMRFLAAVGQRPVLMRRYVPGFILNRLQSALVREAVDLVASGVCGVEAVDDCIRDGLGLRWALMGPFGVANTNADGGVAEYFTRFREAYHGLWATLRTDVRFDDELVRRLARETDAMLRAPLADQRDWRDRMVGRIRRLKAADPLRPAGRPARKRSR